jgi:hypothetical protein
MKKIIVLILAIFMGFSINGVSQVKNHKSVQSAKTEQPKKGKAKGKRIPRKSVPRKRIHKSGPERYSQKKAGKPIIL